MRFLRLGTSISRERKAIVLLLGLVVYLAAARFQPPIARAQSKKGMIDVQKLVVRSGKDSPSIVVSAVRDRASLVFFSEKNEPLIEFSLDKDAKGNYRKSLSFKKSLVKDSVILSVSHSGESTIALYDDRGDGGVNLSCKSDGEKSIEIRDHNAAKIALSVKPQGASMMTIYDRDRREAITADVTADNTRSVRVVGNDGKSRVRLSCDTQNTPMLSFHRDLTMEKNPRVALFIDPKDKCHLIMTNNRGMIGIDETVSPQTGSWIQLSNSNGENGVSIMSGPLPGLRLQDQDRKGRASLMLDEHDNPNLIFFDKNNKSAIALKVLPPFMKGLEGMSTISFYEGENPRMTLGKIAKSWGMNLFHPTNLRSKIFLGDNADGDPTLEFDDLRGEKLLFLQSKKTGSQLQITDGEFARLMAGYDDKSGTFLRLIDAKGDLMKLK
jgi:hypothetical protein